MINQVPNQQSPSFGAVLKPTSTMAALKLERIEHFLPDTETIKGYEKPDGNISKWATPEAQKIETDIASKRGAHKERKAYAEKSDFAQPITLTDEDAIEFRKAKKQLEDTLSKKEDAVDIDSPDYNSLYTKHYTAYVNDYNKLVQGFVKKAIPTTEIKVDQIKTAITNAVKAAFKKSLGTDN